MARVFHLFINLLLSLTSIAYPLSWLWLENSSWLNHLIAIMAILWLIKAMQAIKFQRYFSIMMAILLAIVWFTKSVKTMYWYPVIINGVMLALFGSSLFSSQSLIERVARLQEPNLPPQAVDYTRRVTQIWCVFFIFNIALCILLIFAKQYHWWALYSGAIAYILMGILFVGEWLIRQLIKDRYDNV